MRNRQLDDFINSDRSSTSGSSWVSTSHRYFFVGLGKTASTRIKLTLHMLEGYDVVQEPFPWLHARTMTDETFIPKLADFSETEAIEILQSPSWFRFGFVRNPFDRLFSAYKSFIMQEVAPPSPFYQRVKADIRRRYDYDSRAGSEMARITFKDFVQYVQDTIDLTPDYHWCTMTSGLRPDLIDYDFIGYFENFEYDFRRVLQKLEVPQELMADFLKPVNVSNIHNLPLAAVYDWKLADQVYEIYQKDFETFGYLRNSWLA